MNKELKPVWIHEDVVYALHNRQLSEHGGGKGIRSKALLESALNAPKNKYNYEQAGIEELAASYAFSLAKNHPFVDGNKRTSYVVCRTFLKLNGTDLKATQEEKYIAFLRLAEGALSEEELAAWIREHLATE